MITVILTKDVEGCGRAGDICEVADGFARNSLLRNKVAVVATPQQIKRYEAEKKRREQEKKERKEKTQRIVSLLDGKTITMRAKHDNRTLFAAIDGDAIAQELGSLIDETVPVDIVVIENPIKKLGDYDVELRLDDDVSAKVRVSVTGA